MSINVRQVRDFIVRPVLAHLALPGGLAAEQLVMGTAAQESRFEYIDQLEPKGVPARPGPALGLWQMERATLNDMMDRFLQASSPARQDLRARVVSLISPMPNDSFEQLAGNLWLGAALCRVLYYSRPFRLTEGATPEQLAAWWKKYYNTPLGQGTPEEFLGNYRRLVQPIYA